MKLSFLTLFAFLCFSCEKEYTCQITTSFPDGTGVSYQKTIKAKKRSEAAQICADYQSGNPYGTSFLID